MQLEFASSCALIEQDGSTHHDTHSLVSVQPGICLADLIVEASFPNHTDIYLFTINRWSIMISSEGTNMIRLARNPDPVWRALANDPDANARTREGVAFYVSMHPAEKIRAGNIPHNQFRMDTQLAPKLPDLVLEKLTQRLDQRETLPVRHALRQPSYIVVGLIRS